MLTKMAKGLEKELSRLRVRTTTFAMDFRIHVVSFEQLELPNCPYVVFKYRTSNMVHLKPS